MPRQKQKTYYHIETTRLSADDIPVPVRFILPSYLLRAFFDACSIQARSREGCIIDALTTYCLEQGTDPEDYRLPSKVPEIHKARFAQEVRNTRLPQVLYDMLDEDKKKAIPEGMRPLSLGLRKMKGGPAT